MYKKNDFLIFIGVFCASLLLLASACTHRMEADQGSVGLNSAQGLRWEFSYKGQWYPATVPGNIYEDLLANQLIPDPLYGTNEDSVQWVADKDWTYRLRFDMDAEWASYRHRQLVFEGLDTYAEVRLNGETMQPTDAGKKVCNMFRTWHFDLPDSLKAKDNVLEVTFRPTKAVNASAAADMKYGLRSDRVFTRNAQYMAGWDWGPCLLGCGIWKNVRIDYWNELRFKDVYVYDTLPSIKGNLPWRCEVEVVLEAGRAGQTLLQLKVYRDRKVCADLQKKVKLTAGENRIVLPVEIADPELWWPNGMGEQPLYAFRVTSGRTTRTVRHGLRVIEWKMKEDSIGSSFALSVNGKPVFVRGANWIPLLPYPGVLQREPCDSLYGARLSDARDAHMNMLRVWGGGFYEKDRFYALCDSLGLLVWQDFMFACNPYFVDVAFLNNVSAEAAEQLTRLRNHSCIALWCGNNEVHNCMEDWHLQERFGYTDDFFADMKEQYETLFEKMLAEKVARYHKGVAYIPSTPTFGWEHAECTTHGCSHYYGVWSGEQPFSVWEEKTGRFMSEYGFQAYPEMTSWKTALPEAECRLESSGLQLHQKHNRGYEFVSKGIADYFGRKCTDLDEFSYLSQLLQAYGIGQAIDAHRRQHGHCGGTLYWQLNDCWPVASWSSIDSYGRWKLLHYRVRERYANVAVLCSAEDPLAIYVVNDSLKSVRGELIYQAFYMDGTPLSEPVQVRLNLKPYACVLAARCDSAWETEMKAGNVYVMARFTVGKNLSAERVLFAALPKELQLKKGEIEMQTVVENGQLVCVLHSPVLQYGVQLTSSESKILRYSDNGFTLLPNESRKIIVSGKTPNAACIQVRSYNQIKNGK